MKGLYRFVDTSEDIQDFLTWLSEQKFVSIDTETTGLDIYTADFSVRLAQIGSIDYAWLFELPRWIGLVDDVIQRFSGPIVMHNAGYDIPAFHTHGIEVPWRKIDDTFIALRLAEPTEAAGLKKAANRLISPGASGSQADLAKAMRVNKWDWDTVPIRFPGYNYYAALDVVLTSRLYETPTIKMGMNSPVYAMEMAVKAVTSRMERTGMRVDMDFCAETEQDLREEAENIRFDADSRFGVSLTSTQQVSKWFMSSDAAHMMTKTTPSGNVSVDKEVLSEIQHLSSPAGDLARMILRVRKVEKIASTYFSNFLTRADHENVVHAQIETIAARTGRMSVRQPALQTLPKPSADPESRLVRRAIIPRREGEKLVSCDFNQVELRLAASLSGDAGLVNAFSIADSGGGPDFFTSSARAVYGDPGLLKSDSRRNVIKSFWYSALYGAGVDKMATTAGVTKERMVEIRNGIANEFPRFFTLMKTCENEARETGMISTPYGRKLPVGWDKSYTATNYRIQGAAADVMKLALINLAQAGFEETMSMVVHDEVIFSIPEDDVEDARHLIRSSMDNFDFEVPLTADPSHGVGTWADC